jgi:Nitronate monooxygenase
MAARAGNHVAGASDGQLDQHISREEAVMLTTRFTELVGCSVPLQQAGMGHLAASRLAAAVAQAGGLGSVSVYGGTPAQIATLLDTVRADHWPLRRELHYALCGSRAGV